MNIKQILEYKLIETDSFSLTPYTLFEILLILIITRVILFLVKKIFNRRVKSKSIDIGISYSVFSVIKYILWIIAITLILDSVGVKITFLIAGSAALLVGIGLGLQQIFKDIISGIFLLFERSIKVGDIVELENLIGRVQEIGIRTSQILTRDNIVIVVPNSRFIEDKVINWSTTDTLTRFYIDIGVAYGSDVKLVEKTLLTCASDHKNIAQAPEPFVRFSNFGESSLDFQLYFWSKESFIVENIKSDLRFSIDEAFRNNNILIPFPQRDVHMKS